MGTLWGGDDAPGAPSLTEPTLARVNGQVNGLYAELGRADATPTKAQIDATAGIDTPYARLIRDWKALVAVDLPVLNRQLGDAHLAEIHLQSTAPEEEDSDDIE